MVNLAGEPIAEKRWTPAHLEVLHRSRIDTTKHLVAAINASPTPPQVLVSASAVGFYGTSETASFSEDSPAGSRCTRQALRPVGGRCPRGQPQHAAGDHPHWHCLGG